MTDVYDHDSEPFPKVITPYDSALMWYPDPPEDCKIHLDNFVPCERLPEELRFGSHWLNRPKWFYGMGALSVPDSPFIQYALKHPELRLVDYFPAGEVVPGVRGRILLSDTLKRVFRHAFRELGVVGPPPELCYDETTSQWLVVAQLFSNYSMGWKEHHKPITDTVKELREFFGAGEEWQPMWYREYPLEATYD